MADPATGTGRQTGRGGQVLVIKLGALGDVILALPQLERICEAHAAARVVLLTAPEYEGLVSATPGLDVVAFPRKGFGAMWRLLRWLLRQSFDVVYDLQGSARSRIMTLLTQAARRVGERPGIAYTDTPEVPAADAHAVRRLNALLAAGGLEPPDTPPRLRVPAAAVGKIDAWLRQLGLQDHRLVLVHAGSSGHWPSKRWDEAHFQALARQLLRRDLAVIWIGGVGESGLCRRLAAGGGTAAAGLLSLPELAALGQRAAFAVTGDSGPMHVLAASGLPVYAFFGPTDWRRSHAPGQRERVLSNPVTCSPCHLRVCPPERRHACLSGITPAQVMARLESDGMLSR